MLICASCWWEKLLFVSTYWVWQEEVYNEDVLHLLRHYRSVCLLRATQPAIDYWYASTILSTTQLGTNLDSSSSFSFTSSPFPSIALCRMSAHILRTTVELTSLYLGSPSRNIVFKGHTGPSNTGPHEFNICKCLSSGPSADHVRIPLKNIDAFWVFAYLQMYPVTTFSWEGSYQLVRM